MDDKKTEVSKEKATISSEFASSIHEESNGVSQPTADNCDKKNITTDTDCGGSTKERYSAQDKQDATASASIDDEDFLLRLESSDEDALDSVGVSSSAKTKGDGKEYAILNKSETLFSDIESSDDSIVYEPKNKSTVSKSPSALAEKQPAEKEPSITAKPVNLDEEKKVIESEFDLVESDEEFFEDLPEKTTQLSQETISDKSMEEEGEEQRSATPLIDEEDDDKATEDSDKLKKITASTNIECNLKPPGSPPSIITSDQSLDLLLESSVDIPDQIDQHSTDLPEEKSSLGDDEKEISIDSIPDVMEETIVLSSDTSKEESSFHQTDIVTTEDSVTCTKKAEKLEEPPSTVHSECSENSKNLEKVTNGAENTPISSAILKNDSETKESDVEIAKEGDFKSSKKTKESTHDPENISVNQLDQRKTDDETDELIAEEIILDGDDEIDEKRSEVKDSLASLEEEPMEIDETILDVSDVTEMETTEENTGDQCISQNQSSKPIEKLAIEEQEINLELKKQSEEIKEVPIEQSTESSKIDNDKLTELDQMPMEIASHQKKVEKSNNEENLIKEADSKEAAVNIELGTIEIEKTKADDKQVKNSKLSADKEMEEVEPTEEDTMKKKTDEVVDLLEKTGDSTKSLSNAQNEIKKCAEITPSPADDHKENKEGIPKSLMEENKSSKTSEHCMEIQVDTVRVEEMKNTIIQGTEKSNEQVTESSKKIEKQDEKSDRCVPDVTENVESEQTQVDTLKESHTQASDLNEEKLESSKGTVKPSSDESQEQPNGSTGNIESSKETVEPSLQESNKQLIGSSEELESSKKVVDLLEESHSCEKHESSKESLETSKESSEEAKQKITENEESVIETLKSEDEMKLAEHETESIEKQEPSKSTALSQKTDSSEMKESLKETSVSIETDSVEKEKSMKETAGLEEIDIIKKQDSIVSQKTSDSKEPDEIIPIKPSEVVVSYTETIVESVKTTVTTTETATDGAVEKVVEVATTSTESTKTKQTTKIDPDVIEIDDDDEEIQEKNKSEDSSRKDEKSTPSTCGKDLQDTQNDDALKTTQNKEGIELVTPMDIDEEITSKKLNEKPPVEEKTTNSDAKTDQESTVKEGNTSMKNIPFQVIDDDEEPLLMIDTSHKEDNDAESNCMDTETATSTPTTDSSSDGSLEVFYDKECVNYECKRASKNFYRATVFAMNYFKVSKKRTKLQFVCEDCYDRALSSYEELCKTLKLKQPLLHGTTFKCQEFVEIIDSSDEDESDVGEGDKAKDENALPKESIEMLEAELEGAIRKVMYNVDIQKQLSWTKQILQQRLTNIQEDSDFVSEQLRALQKKADHMHNSLYQCPKIKLRQLTPLDLNSGRMYNPESDNSISIPLPGDIIRNPICVNELYYAVKTKAIASWVPCKVIEEIEGYPAGYNQTKTYKIRFTTKLAKYPMFKTVYAKHMAYHDPPNVRLPIGSRVIAYFDATSLSRGKEKMLIPSAFYPGIIAEPLKQSNKFRYLVFYDDGYFQYVNHKDVRLVCQASENVWEDVHHQSREFIHNYLTQYAVNRPMVQTQKGQSMLVDYNGKWIYARVIDVDCSLVQMLFEGQSRSEWIYRGSTRLGPVYKESNNLSQKNTLNATRRRTEPFIRYINGDDSSSSQQVQETEQPQAKAGTSENRSVAKKSVSRVDNSNNNSTAAPSTSSSSAQPVPTVRHLNNSTIFVDDDNKPKGKVVYYTARKNLPPRNYVPHICNPSCPFNITHNLSFYSPLAKPLLSGWERQVFRQKSKKFIVYRGPCGKRMRNIEELHRYLRVTDNELNVDNFDFSPDTNCLAEYVLEKCLVNKKDISCGKEKMPIPCVNYYDETMPPACEYSAVRIPTEGVPLNLDKEFLCGCDCEDDCSDKTKCACWQLTYAGAKYGMPTVPTDMVGYQYKRLYEHVPTGIYECNSRCKCKANCVNRVVQQPLQSKLQVFKTSNRGWGLRCINDVPRGSFICVYAGQMLTEQVANEGGLDAGDEYFAELDYIEVAEQIKEGYESDVQEPEEDEDLYNPEREDDDIDFRGPDGSLKDKEFNTRLRSRKGNKNSTDGECDSQERQVISFEPNKTMDTSNEPNEKPTIRKLFGRDESCYVMDAKVRGNLGRYFNHSCSPNLFVQNVFVDTHDLRFPWVAFFASTHIRAGTELTWNYNYEVGVVPGKVLYCQCGAPNCRQRLL